MRRGEQLGKYRIRRRIASGSFATVYEARDLVLDLCVALKVPRYEEDHDLMLDEIRHVMALEHPNVLPILNADYADGRLIIATPLGRESLREQMKRGLEPESALAFARQMLLGLAHAHERGVIHRDVKPENLIVFADGHLRLCDFGLAKSEHQSSSGTSGTVGYLAPEQALGSPSKASDVFAAALVIWEMLTHELPKWPFTQPFEGHETVDRVAPGLRPVLEHALTVDETARYPDAGMLLRAFDERATG